MSMITDLAGICVQNRFIEALPGDESTVNLPRTVLAACYSRVAPQIFSAPKLIAYARDVATSLGFHERDCASEAFLRFVCGQNIVATLTPYAMCYGGHQFGHWAGQLGDGRAITLGEIVDRSGRAQALQLKGAGPTPYSRGADGYAVLRSSIREFLCSEAMHYLGVPTTRALSLVVTGETVVRDMFYDGRPRGEPGAVVCRVAPSFLRFGNYQIFASRGDIVTLRRLADFTIETYFPQLATLPTPRYLAWFRAVAEATIEMIVGWQRVGFVHGVMNTDNMSILGLTLDYGPYGWLEPIDPDWTPNTTDAAGRRYAFGNQPDAALWNLAALANAIAPLVDADAELDTALRDARRTLATRLREMQARKLGFQRYDEHRDDPLLAELERLCASVELDMTLFYRALAGVPSHGAELDDDALLALVAVAIYDDVCMHIAAGRALLLRWLRNYIERLRSDGCADEERMHAMYAVNPAFVLRNYLVQAVIEAAQDGDNAPLRACMDALRTPYATDGTPSALRMKCPAWARQRPGCSMLSCSS